MHAASSSRLDDELARIRFRRAVMLLLMTLVVPGSAQLVAGRKRLGRVALRVWLTVIGSLLFVVLLGLAWSGFVYWLISNRILLAALRPALVALGLGWAILFADAWRLGRPLELRQKQRLAVVGLNGVLSLVVVGALSFASHVVTVQQGMLTAMFGKTVVSSATSGRYNVLLLGGDSGADRWGLRADSITVASVDAETGRTVLFGLPRNLQNFPFRPGSVMARQFPRGFTCDGCYLNSLSTWAADNPALFKKYDDPGVEATTEAVEGITGLKINYYAMVNLQGFRNLIDAVGGVVLNVRDPIPIGGVGADVTGYIKPGRRRLDGFQTLWFARSREGADDYSRMARQKCVMNAMLRQLSPRVVLTKFEAIAQASRQLVSTNLPASELDRFLALAAKARSQPVTTVSFVPPAVDTSRPDIPAIRAKVAATIERASSDGGPGGSGPAAAQGPRGGKPAGGRQETTGGSIGSLAEGYAANDAGNLSRAC